MPILVLFCMVWFGYVLDWFVIDPHHISPAAKQSKLVGLRKVVVEPSNLVCSLLISIEFNSVEEPIRKMMRQCVKRLLKIAI